MTRKMFEADAIRMAERSLAVPAGWWGKWSNVTDGVYGVRQTAQRTWRLTRNGELVSRHDSRDFAIKKATKMANALRKAVRQ